MSHMLGFAIADEPASDDAAGHFRPHAAPADDSGDGAGAEIFHGRLQVLVQGTPEYGFGRLALGTRPPPFSTVSTALLQQWKNNALVMNLYYESAAVILTLITHSGSTLKRSRKAKAI